MQMLRQSDFRMSNDHAIRHDISIIKPSLSKIEARISLDYLPLASRCVMGDSMRSAWFCLQVFEHAEKDVEDILQSFDVETWVPRGEVYTYPSRGRMVTSGGDPIMPEYVLVRCAFNRQAFRGLVSVVNVVRLVGGNISPAPLSDKEINRFKGMVQKGEYKEMPIDTSLKEGDGVSVNVGPFASFSGRIMQLAKKRAKVRILLFGRLNEVTIPLAHLRKL